jgi:hypothetical protein
LERNEEQANSVVFLGEIFGIFFSTINSTNFFIFWETNSPNFKYHKNIRKNKKTKKTLTTMQKRVDEISSLIPNFQGCSMLINHASSSLGKHN